MKTKKYIIRFFIIVFLFFCFTGVVLYTALGHDINSNLQWIQKKKELNNIDISKITFYTGGVNGREVKLVDNEKDNFTRSLVNSKFYKSNWKGMVDGGLAIIIIFKDGTKDSFEYCGGSVFQITYKGKMFSVRNKELEQILLSYKVSL